MRRPEETHKRQRGSGAAGRRGRTGVARETLGGRYASLRDRGHVRARAGLGARPRSRRTSQSPVPRPARRSRKCRDRSGVEAPPLPPAQDILGVVVAVLSSKTPFHRSEPDPTRSSTRPGLGHLQRGWWARRPGKSAGPWKEPIAAAFDRHPRTTTPDPHRAPGSAPSFRPGGVARPCGSGSPRARFTAPCAPQARRSRGVPAGRYATEAA